MGFLLVWMESEGRGLVWRGHLYWVVGSPVYVGYVVASGGLGFLIGEFLMSSENLKKKTIEIIKK